MQALVLDQEATALEMYMAVAPDRAPPQALVDNHAVVAIDKGLDVEPRVLAYSDAGDSFRYWSHNALADCDYWDDRNWFEDLADGLGMGTPWFARSNNYGMNSGSRTTDLVLAEMCSDGPSGNKTFRIRKSGPGTCAPGTWYYAYTTTVTPEHRVWFLSSDSGQDCTYQARASNPIGQTRRPTYNVAIAGRD